MRDSEKTTENFERLGRQARPGFEPDTSRLPVLSVTTPPLVGPDSAFEKYATVIAITIFDKNF